MLSFIPRDGELSDRIRHHPWQQTLLGPLTSWPPSLRTRPQRASRGGALHLVLHADPLPGGGSVDGFFCPAMETAEQVMTARQVRDDAMRIIPTSGYSTVMAENGTHGFQPLRKR